MNIKAFEESLVQLSKTIFVLSGLVFSLIKNSATDTQSYKQPHHYTQSTVLNSHSKNWELYIPIILVSHSTQIYIKSLLIISSSVFLIPLL